MTEQERTILDFIGQLESGGNYNAIYGRADSQRDLSTFMLDQINALQLAHGKRAGSSAFGKYQFIRKTLLGLRTRMNLTGTERFTPELQDRMALSLLIARGLRRWQAAAKTGFRGRDAMTDDKFMDALSKEWASLPYRTGRSYYDGDGLNHALTTRAQFKAVLQAARGG